jgi:hypothetical protein
MTNTQQITMNHNTPSEGIHDMHGWTEQTQAVVRDRIRAREVEAASERLAATAHTASAPGSIRRRIGRLLIQVGRRVGGEAVSPASPAGRPAHPMAA